MRNWWWAESYAARVGQDASGGGAKPATFSQVFSGIAVNFRFGGDLIVAAPTITESNSMARAASKVTITNESRMP